MVHAIRTKQNQPQKIQSSRDPRQSAGQPTPDPRQIRPHVCGRPRTRNPPGLAETRRWATQPHSRSSPGPAETWQRATGPLPHLGWRTNRSTKEWCEAIRRGQWAPSWRCGRPQAHGRICLGSCVDSGSRLGAWIRLGSCAVSRVSSVFHACFVCFFTHKMTIQISTNIS